LVDAVTGHPRIEILPGSEVTELSGTVGRYSASIDGNGRRVEAGAIVVATGARPHQPWGVAHYRYDGKRVTTQLEFERDLSAAAPPSSVAMILCAGQRDEAVPYCSGVCCIGALQQAVAVKAAAPQVAVTVLYRDLNLLGEKTHEKTLAGAQQAGVQFIRYAPAALPKVTEDGVEVVDATTGAVRHVPCDRVVLATPLVPQPDASVMAHLLGITQDEHGFFPDVRYRLRPESYADRGIYVCGAAHYPVDRVGAELEAVSAAFKAVRHVRAGQVASFAPVARVDETLCTGCAQCVGPCPFSAITMHRRDEVVDLSQIDPLRCTGCGNCVVACPVKAISQPVDGDAQILAQIEAALATVQPNGRSRILVFGCEWSGHAAAELAGAKKVSYPVETRLIRMRCSARFDPIHVLWALLNGADGVFLGACAAGDCHYVDGNRYAQERIDVLRDSLAKNGFDPRRVRMEWIVPDDPHDFVKKVSGFTELVAKL
jgi:heterodisulfide reductase subunit A